MPEQSGRYAYMVNVLRGVGALGGSASPSDVYEWLRREGLAVPADLVTIQKDGGTRFKKEVRWARQELFAASLLHGTPDGKWNLASAEMEPLSVEQARQLVRIRAQLRRASHSEGAFLEPLEEVVTTPPIDVISRPTTGPSPTDWSRNVTRTSGESASTYVARFGERDVWKIGFAGSIEKRLNELNRHVPSEVLAEQWRIYNSYAWPNAVLAYRMEQAVLAALSQHRTTGERLHCRGAEIDAVWRRLVS
jgi:hypothetical protein